MLVWWAGQVGDLPWMWALLCGGSALVLWYLTRIPPTPIAAANPTLPRPPQPQGASKSLDLLSTQSTPILVTSSTHVPRLLDEGEQRKRRSSSSRTKVQHPSSSWSPGQSRILCTDTASPCFHFLILLSVWITSYRPIDLFLGNVTTGSCLFSVDPYCHP